MEAARIILTNLLPLLLSQLTNVHCQTTCNLVVGQYSLCQCEMSDGSGIIDLSPYGNDDGHHEFMLSADTNGVTYEYIINLCFPLNEGGTCGTSQTSAGCQRRASDSAEWSMGGYSAAQFIIDEKGTSLYYGNGEDGRTLTIHLKCDHDVPITSPGFTFDGEEVFFQYEFTLTSICACPSPSGKCGDTGGGGGGGGGDSDKSSSDPGVVGIVLLCLAFTAFVGYFIVGAVFLRVRHQKTGTDLIINKAFWKDFPYLVKDGFVFTFSPLYNVIRGRGYNSMPS